MGQLARIVLGGSSGSPDEQDATPEEGGSYGALMEEIDHLLAQGPDGKGRPDPKPD